MLHNIGSQEEEGDVDEQEYSNEKASGFAK
jgi:hypothetical protein